MATKTTTKKTTSKPSTTAAKTVGATLPHFTVSGTAGKSVAVPEVLKQKANPTLVAQAMRVYKQRARQGTQFTKTRSEVIGSTRKIYRQKGTGRARHGDIKAPIFVGGGITFGPKPREFSTSLPQKMRHQALLALLSDKVNHDAATVLSGLADSTGKTKDMVTLLKKMGIAGKKLLVIVAGDMQKAVKATRNIENVAIRPVSTLSALDVIASEHVVFADEALKQIK